MTVICCRLGNSPKIIGFKTLVIPSELSATDVPSLPVIGGVRSKAQISYTQDEVDALALAMALLGTPLAHINADGQEMWKRGVPKMLKSPANLLAPATAFDQQASSASTLALRDVGGSAASDQEPSVRKMDDVVGSMLRATFTSASVLHLNCDSLQNVLDTLHDVTSEPDVRVLVLELKNVLCTNADVLRMHDIAIGN